MPNNIEYALMAGRAYQSTRADINRFPAPEGWYEPLDKRKVLPGGFEAGYFQRGTEIVISYAGTGPGLSDWDANSGLALGFGSDQLRQAALYYLEVKEVNPTATISFTGHSLGGGLAALMGVFFDEQAVTFDQAPFANSASSGIRDDLVAYLNGQGYSNSQLATLAPELLSYGGYGTRIANVTGYFVQGEALQYVPFSTLGSQTQLAQNSTGLGLISGPVSLHSQALLSAFLLNDTFRLITFKLPELLKMVFDEALYAHKTTADNTEFVNFLEHLIRHQAGVQGSFAAAAMLDRFTLDLQKVAQDGGFTLTNAHITNTLVAFAMQMYYENPEAAVAGKTLFTDVSGGIRFDRSDVSAKLADAKGWQMYFQNYLAEGLTLEEHQIVLKLLPAATDWFIQAGSVSMSAAADAGKAFMVGGIGDDWMVGGSEADLLIGNAGEDTLRGGINNDTLIGGAGFDTYLINAGDGYDTILDSDGLGVIKFGTVETKGSAGVDSAKWKQPGTDTWADTQNNITYARRVVNGETQLLIFKGASNIVVQGWADGELGIGLGAGAPPTPPAPPATTLTYIGDQRAPIIGVEIGTGVRPGDAGYGTYDWDAVSWAADGTLTGGVAAPGFNDVIYGSAGNDRIDGLSGNDALDGSAGADRIDGGLGDDLIGGGTGSDLIYGGAGNDEILSATGLTAPQRYEPDDNWIPPAGTTAWIVGSTWGVYQNPGNTYTIAGGGALYQDDAPDIVYAGDGDDAVTGGRGDDTLDGGAGNDTLRGHGGDDIIDGGDGDDTIEGDGTVDPGFYSTVAESLHGDDILSGGAGKDRILGGGGYDLLLGGAGEDKLYGGAGDDILEGGEGIDYLEGGAGDDIYLNVSGEDTVYDSQGDNTLVLTAAGLGAAGLAAATQASADGSPYMQLAVALDDGGALKLDNSFFDAGVTTLQFANGDTADLETLVGESLATPLSLQLGDAGGRVYGGAGADALYGGAGGDTLVGHYGDDTLSGDVGNDILDGGAGMDRLEGGAGDDIYLNVTGEDVIYDTEGSNTIRLATATGLGAAGLSVVNTGDMGQYRQLNIALDTGETLKLNSPFFDTHATLQFANDQTLDLETLVSTMLTTPLNLKLGDNGGRLYGGAGADALYGGAGNDALVGHRGDDTLNGGAGNDILEGGAGNDHYVFSGGRDTIVEDLSGAGLNALLVNAALNDLSVTQQTESDGSQTLSLTLADGSGVDIRNGFLGAVGSVTFNDAPRLTLHDLLNARVAQGLSVNGTATKDRLFGGAGDDVLDGLAGADSLYGGGGNDVMVGGDGVDILLGEAGADTLEGGAGRDTLYGGAGDDAYALDMASGGDYIDDREGANLIRFAADITTANLTASLFDVAAETGLLLRAGGQKVATIVSGLDAYRFEFADGTQLSAAEFLHAYVTSPVRLSGDGNANALYGGRGADTLYGYEGDDVLQGGTGGDSLRGGLGSDIYRYNLGDGLDVIEEEDDPATGQTTQDRVVFGAGIAVADVAFQHLSNGDLAVTVAGQDNAITVKGWYGDPARRVESFAFADGTQVDAAALALLAVAPTLGTTGNDTMLGEDGVDVLMGQSGDDLLAGNGGDDELHGGVGADTYRLASGGGADRVFEEAGETSFIELYGQDLSRLTGTRTGDDLVLGIADADETMTLQDYYTQSHDWRVKDVPGAVRGLAENAARNASLDEMDRLQESFAAAIKDTAIRDYIAQGLQPQADGSWQSQPNFLIKKQFTDYERLPGWSGYVPADSTYYYFNNTPWYTTGRFSQPVYSSDAAEIGEADFWAPPPAWGKWVPSKVQVAWDSRSQYDPKQTAEIGEGHYQYYDFELLAMLEALRAVDPGIAGIANPYIYTATPTYTYQNTFTNRAATVLSIAPADGTGYSIDAANPASFFNLTSLPGTLNVSLYVSNMDRKLYEIEGGNNDNIIDLAALNGDFIVHAGAGNDTIKGATFSDSNFSYYPYTTYKAKETLLDGGVGDDLIDAGGGGADLIIGGVGNDLLKGGSGQDRYYFMTGQPGIDVIVDGDTNYNNLFGNDFFGLWWAYLQNPTGSASWEDLIPAPKANDFQAIEATGAYTTVFDASSVYDVGGRSLVIPPDTAVFGEGVALSEIGFSWGSQAVEVVAWDESSSGARWHQTLDITWQPGATARFVLPRADSEHGFGVEYFEFADGTLMTIGQMVALAGPSPEHAPVLGVPLSEQTATEDLPFSYTIPGDAFADTDAGEELSYQIQGESPAWLSFDPATRRFSGTPGAFDLAPSVITVAALDRFGESVSATFTLNVAPINAVNGTIGDDVLVGTSASDRLTGLDGNDTLDGGAGVDKMIGGVGDDMYVVNDLGDVVTENANEGTDTIQSSVVRTLDANVENLTLTGTAAINGTGNELDNVLRGNVAVNTLDGLSGDDTLYAGDGDSAHGGAGNDSLISENTALKWAYLWGDDGDDTLTGSAGSNALFGGAGNDTITGGTGFNFISGDDFAGAAGNDIIHGGNNDDFIMAGGGNDLVYGNDGNDILTGDMGDDTLNGGADTDTLSGQDGNDALDGGDGNDRLDGGAGADALAGGTGNDTYVIDSPLDAVTENLNEGIDSVESSITYTLAANLEALTLTGTAAINATDNTLNNLLIGNSAINTLTAGSGNDILQGGAGNDILRDSAGTNLLAGGAGSDSLSGASGAELYLGGSGNDTLSTGTGTDILAFNRGDGVDTVVASSGQDNTLSLGGGIKNSDLVFRKSSNDLILDTGNSESIVLQGWYAASTNHSVLTLQMIEEAAADFAPGGADPLRDNKVEQFNFAGLADQFDQARSANPSLTSWSLSNALLDFYLGGSDSTAIGGDLAYQYGKTGSLSNIGFSGAQSVLGNAQFGQLNQAINQPGLADGLVKLSA